MEIHPKYPSLEDDRDAGRRCWVCHTLLPHILSNRSSLIIAGVFHMAVIKAATYLVAQDVHYRLVH
jgi:hypothetical protein